MGASLSRTTLTIGELGRALSADVIIRVVLIRLALRTLLVISTKNAPRNDLRAELTDMVLIHTISFLTGTAFFGGLASETVLYDGAG